MKRAGKPFFLFYLLAFILILPSENLRAQADAINDNKLQLFPGNQYFPSWSADGRIVFQSDKNGYENIYLFDPAADSIAALTADTINEQHPVWVPGKEAVVYDAGYGKESRLFYLDLKTGKTRLLLRRKIACREASFTPLRHLVVFSGFDDRTQHWQIFSYDFIYDNLNRLTSENGNCSFPVFSPDGKTIAYIVRTGGNPTKLKTINWYGEEMKAIASNVRGRACWTPDSWRLLYISKVGNHYVISSIRNDGTHKVELLSSLHPLCCPTLSANGKRLIFSMKSNNRFHIVTLLGKNPE
jgi:Tol biopolymer transport system component